MTVVKCSLLKKKRKAFGSSDDTQLKAKLKTPRVSCRNIYQITLEDKTVHSRLFYHSKREGLKKFKTNQISSSGHAQQKTLQSTLHELQDKLDVPTDGKGFSSSYPREVITFHSTKDTF